MILISVIDVAVVIWLSTTVLSKGFANVLPRAACLLLLFPVGAQIKLPGLFDLTTQRIIVLTLCALYLAVGRNEQHADSLEPIPLKGLFACLIGWMLLSSARSVVPVISFKSTLSQCFDFCTVYFIYVRNVRTSELLNKVLAGFVAGAGICSVFGILQVYFGWDVNSLFPAVMARFSYLGSENTRGYRVESTFGSPILFGAALALAIPMALYLIGFARSRMEKVRLWVLAAMMILCIYKTNSRGAWLALGLSVALLLILGTGRLRKLLVILGITTLLVLVARPGIRDSVLDLYGATLDPESPQGESYQWRYALYDIAHRELAKNFGRSLWGYGPESFYYLGLTTDFMVEGQMHTVKVESCDSAVVELMMDTGYVGLLLVAALLGAGVVSGVQRYFTADDENGTVYLILIGNVLAFAFLMTNVELFGWGQQSYMLWIILALMVRPQSCDAEEQSSIAEPAFPERLDRMDHSFSNRPLGESRWWTARPLEMQLPLTQKRRRG